MDSALLSPADQQVLKEARQLNQRPSVPNMPSIKLKSSEKKMLDAEGKPLLRGNYYIETYENEEKRVRDIGANPVVTILHRCFTYSYYDDDAQQLVAWTSEIDDFGSNEPVYLYAKKNGKAFAEFVGTYGQFKAYKDANYSVAGKGSFKKSLLKFQNCLYVIFEGQVCRLFVKNTGAVGVPPGTNVPDYNNPQLESLDHFISTTRGPQMDAALLEFDCQLGSRFIEDAEQPFFIMTFKNAGPNEKVPETIAVFKKLRSDRATMRQWDIDRMSGKSEAAPDPTSFGEDGVIDIGSVTVE